jgi:dienelactone hydrolase
MKKIVFSLLFMALLSVPAWALVVGKEVTYTDVNGTTMKGYIAYDDATQGKRPGVLVVHEWWGHNAYARKRADMLAGLGYIALAVDMYGDGKTASHPDDAGKFAGEIKNNLPMMQSRFNAALELLKSQELTDPEKIGAIGYCFGGSVVLSMARQGADLKGVASFHGGLSGLPPVSEGAVKGRVLVLNGADDSFNPADQIEKFKQEMLAAKADYKFVNYDGAKHGFTNPDADQIAKDFKMDIAYNAKADQESWAEMKTFFEEVFK